MTLVDASHTPDQLTSSETRDSEAGSAKLPVRQQLYFLRQRTILTIRLWFRLPIDDVKEAKTQEQINALVQLCQKQMETMKTLVRVSNNMQARLHYYEENIPRMRELKIRFDRELGRKIDEAAESQDAASSGLLVVPSNGDKKASLLT